MKKLIPYIILLLLAACDVPIQLDPEQTAPIPVIEGLVTDDPQRNHVRITRTVDFYHEGPVPAITNAVVRLSDGTDTYDYEHYDGTDVDSMGMYFPPVGFSAVTGRTYTLTVEADGETFTATEVMQTGVPVGSMDVRVDPDEESDPAEEGRYYRVFFKTEDPRDSRDFYLFKFYRNDTLTRASDDDIYLADDVFISATISGIPFPFYCSEGDNATVEIYKITESAFFYYQGLSIAINNDGGLFSPPPANPRSNFEPYSPGYFLVAPVSKSSTLVE